jgi:hypothetical protein
MTEVDATRKSTALKYGSFATAAINKDGHAGIIIMRPETIFD